VKLGAIVLDTDNVEELSDFYAKMLGWTKSSQIHKGKKWITVIKADYMETPLVFQENHDYIHPVWPSNEDKQQQMLHMDFYVRADEFEEKVEHAIKCGARIAETQFTSDWKVMLDCSGHPFCIIPIPKEIYEQRYGS